MGMRTMLTRLAGKLDLPTDIAAGLPRIALNGFSECSLDRHRGILEYSTERIVVALNIGELTVEGQKLELRQMHRERLCITGRIACCSAKLRSAYWMRLLSAFPYSAAK